MLVFRYRILAGTFLALSTAYISLSLLLPQDKAALNKYHITSGQDIALVLTIAIPYIVIWLVALVGYLRFKLYSDTIKKSKDGAAFHIISLGLLWLAMWLPLSAVLGVITTGYYRAHASATAQMVVLNNYINIVILLLAFWYMLKGTNQLLHVIKKPAPRLPQSMMMLFIASSAIFMLLVLHDPARQFPANGLAVATYYLPDWLTVLTIVVPTLITWHMGMQAVYNMYLYRKGVKGQIYKNAFSGIASGLSAVIIVLVVLRFFETLSSQVSKLALGPILLIIYLLLVALSVGYIRISKGAKNLQYIEDI